MSPVHSDNDSEASWWLLLQREAAEIKRLADPAGSRVGQSSPCSCNPLVSLWPSISTLPFVVGPISEATEVCLHHREVLKQFFFLLWCCLLCQKLPQTGHFWSLSISPSSYLHVFPPSSSHLMADLNLHALTPSCSYIFVNSFYWK